MNGRAIPYLPEELAWIEANCHLPRTELHSGFCFRFGRRDVTVDHLKALCTRKGWQTGRSGCFPPGNVPANKGKKMPYHPNSAATRFRKGQRPHTWRGAGHESIDREGYVWLIVDELNPHTGADTRRVQKHRWLWERANGPVPDGHVLKCLDGDKTNTDPSNWEPIPKALLPRLNARFGRDYDAAPAEIKPTLLAITKLEHEARTLRRSKERAANKTSSTRLEETAS